ncbi:MAG: Caspase domain-containing protein [Cyanobacteria bacterium P01_H01_bin.119]
MIQRWQNLGLAGAIALGLVTLTRSPSTSQAALPTSASQFDPSRSDLVASVDRQPYRFLVMGGGGAPSYNEIALEKNFLYFQRTLGTLGLSTAAADFYFANGTDGQATVRYIDEQGQEQFKPPEIPELAGASTRQNLMRWIATRPSDCPSFFYFTGHGTLNRRDIDNNAMLLWGDDFFSVQTLARLLDQTSPQAADQPFVTMMAQCFSGSFANLIYEEGDPGKPVALQTRCGFFATVATRPSVGCTPMVNEADYRDYSSSFFAGLSGVDRSGLPVASADYNRDDTISFAEAHAFAKVDEETSDWPISTVEAWLQRRIDTSARDRILNQPLADWQGIARAEQQFVIAALSEKLQFDQSLSYAQNLARTGKTVEPDSYSVEQAYLMRLQMELVNVAAEAQVRTSDDGEAIAVLDRLIACEASSPTSVEPQTNAPVMQPTVGNLR